MPVLATELARMAGPNCKEVISAVLKRWEDKLREHIRSEMALKLTDESEGGRQVQRVAVRLALETLASNRFAPPSRSSLTNWMKRGLKLGA
jgi:hypothetical protein